MSLSNITNLNDFMLFCPACGTENARGSQFCMNCGSALPKSEIQRSEYRPREEEYVHPIAYLCACCVPLAGFVIWLVIKDENPESANTILLISIISFVVGFILGVA